ncbi:hypothetical protein J5N97_027718 [Dioscorea zingiberensis]|uniref:EMC1 first beta-propeller domain-containing protein n=1 Tax=Dioscorea zingiberensis TaxID=325984 RepID=A0A9D5H484_9LILI|nr:hypothetical protein J5N97_027718 [Dioscorea zingiberensis]
MAVRASLLFLLLLSSSLLAAGLYEDQVGLADWHQKYIGKTKQAVFHTQKAGRKRVVVSTEENAIASLDLRTGDIYWRHVLGKNDPIDQIDVALGKYVVTLSSEGSVLRAWNLPDGQMIWESSLRVLKASKSLLYVPANIGVEKDNIIHVYSGGCLHAISSMDGEVVWTKEFASEGLNIQGVSQPLGGGIIYIVGFTSTAHVVVYQVNGKTGELLNQNSLAYPSGFSGEALQVSSDMLVALDAARSTLVTINFQGGDISFHQTPISNLVQESFVMTSLLPVKVNGMFAAKVDSTVLLARVKRHGCFRDN